MRQRCGPTQLHCEPENCVISLTAHPPVFSPSLAVPLPHTGGKCSLKASPPTTKISEITVYHKSTIQSSLTGGSTCSLVSLCITHCRAFPRHCKSHFPNVLLVWKYFIKTPFYPTNLHTRVYKCYYKHTHSTSQI